MSGWYMQAGAYPRLDGITTLSGTMTPPYPLTIWHIGALTDGGYPYLPLWGTAVRLVLEPLTLPGGVHVYHSRETDFSGNGNATIEPITCTVRQEKNGLYEADLTAAIDPYGKSEYLVNGALLQIPVQYHEEIKPQLFRIYDVRRSMDTSGAYRIAVHAKHVFYDLSDYLLTDCRPTRLDGQSALDWIFDGIHGSKPQGFVYRSGISRTRTAYYIHQSVTAALLGADNAFVNRWGGVLYRDNFYFSLHAQMEYSRDTGVIRYGFNMTEIKMTVDDSECITYLMAEDNFGNSTIVRNDDVPNAQFPHHRCRYVKFNYEEADRAQFLEDAQAYFDNYSSPAVNIKVKFADIRGNDLYKDFLELTGYEVGDRVIVYHKDLGISYENLEIISKTQDAVNGETADIEIGSFRNAIVRESYMAGLTSAGSSAESKQLAAMQEQLDQTTAKQLMYWDNLEDYTWDELEQYTWDMLEGEY